MPNKKIYLAGKISEGDWRKSVVANTPWPNIDYSTLHELEYHSGQGLAIYTSCNTGSADTPKVWPVLECSVAGIFDYVGPYFIGCDHGCFHGNSTHGCIDGVGMTSEEIADEKFSNTHGLPVYDENGLSLDVGGYQRRAVTSLCLKAIHEADIIYAWIDAPDAYGTYTELGYAAALGKEIYIACPKEYIDMWFIYNLSTSTYIVPTPLDGLTRLIEENGYMTRPKFDSPIEEMFWDAWQRNGGAKQSMELEYQYSVPGMNYRLDFANLEEKVAIELDGYEYHNGKEQFTKDRRRHRDLEKAGWRIIRFSGSEVYQDADRCYREASDFVISLWVKRTSTTAQE